MRRFEWLFLRNSAASASCRVPRSLSKRGRSISVGFRILIFFVKRFLKPTNLKGEGLVYENWNVIEKKIREKTIRTRVGLVPVVVRPRWLSSIRSSSTFILLVAVVVVVAILVWEGKELHYRFSILKKRVNRVGVLYTIPFVQWLRCAP